MTTQTARPVYFCQACQHGTSSNATICPNCVDELKQLLGDVRALLRELNVALSRQSRIGPRLPGGKGSEAPLPFDLAASEAADVLLAHTITRWALDIWRHGRQTPGQTWARSEAPKDPVAYLLSVVDLVKGQNYAAVMLDEIRAAVQNARETIDLSKDYLEAGACPTCSARLLARPGDVQIECRRCGATYDVGDRRLAMLADAEDRLLTAKECERLVDVLLRHGESDRVRKRIPAGSVRGWASRGELEAVGVDLEGRPTYRFGDVLDKALGVLVTAA